MKVMMMAAWTLMMTRAATSRQMEGWSAFSELIHVAPARGCVRGCFQTKRCMLLAELSQTQAP
jgi:hypothetical protein